MLGNQSLSDPHRLSMAERWAAAWRGLGAAPEPGLHAALLACYREPQRRYHTLHHLSECFEQFDRLGEAAVHPAEVALALWFHDAIYDPRGTDNELRSADWARSCAVAAGVAPESADRVHALVMATRHAARPEGADAEVLIDLDLWILAAPPERFAEYEQQVRGEYAWVPADLFARERARILEGFLDRPWIYSTRLFRERHESDARRNLARSLASLARQAEGPAPAA